MEDVSQQMTERGCTEQQQPNNEIGIVEEESSVLVTLVDSETGEMAPVQRIPRRALPAEDIRVIDDFPRHHHHRRAAGPSSSSSSSSRVTFISPFDIPLNLLSRVTGTFSIFHESFLQEMMQADSDGRFGSPPVAEEILKSLKSETLTNRDSGGECVICQEVLKEGDNILRVATQSPTEEDDGRDRCNHFFHFNCIVPWLSQHSSCPVCRYELPTDDEAYERRKTELRVSGTRL